MSKNNPYHVKTSYEYDSWMKKLKTIDYLGKITYYTYSKSDRHTIVHVSGYDFTSNSAERYDDLGRKIESWETDINGNQSRVSYLYDSQDRNYKIGEPFKDWGATQWNETKYDAYGRVIQKISFTGKTVTISYSGLTTTVNDGQKTKITTKDAIGNIVSVTDSPGGTIRYTYFANGNLKSSDYDGVITLIEQDDWGRKTKLTDPSAGVYCYTYNGFGETTSETTPNGTTTYSLDPFGNLISKTIVGSPASHTNSSTVYTYDSSKLLLSSTFTSHLESGAVTTKSYTYDRYKRLEKITETTPYAVFTKQLSFDTFGRTDRETSTALLLSTNKTSSRIIRNTYKNGFPWQIIDYATQKVLWETNSVNVRGQLTNANLGNGISITNTYDPYGFLTESRHLKMSGSDSPLDYAPIPVLKLATRFDPIKGNLTSRISTLFNDAITSEIFKYDALDRLTDFVNAQGEQETQSYDDRGRITQNNIGTYNYSNKDKPYQNNSILLSAQALEYYSNRKAIAPQTPQGPAASVLGLNITYNAFKSPVTIEEKGNDDNYIDKISFTYNDDNYRSAMFYGGTQIKKEDRPLRKFYSADGTMEIKQNIETGATEFITYIGGDGYSAPLVLKSNGTSQNYLYLHRDYQGSILAITDDKGAVLEKCFFDAWGAIVKVQDGAGNILNGLTILDRGYTGHEHLQSVGLINMNGRLYDPKLRRFLQPDNFVQEPFNTQNYNRYGYVLNNPLRYTDPSGEFWHIVIGAVVGGVVNWGTHGFQFNGAGASYFGTGAAAGVVTMFGGPLAGAAVLGAGNSLTDQVSVAGWNNINVGQLLGDTTMSVGTAYLGGQLTQGLSPYIDKTIGQVVKNSILKESLTQGVTNSISGFGLGAFVAGANGASFSDAIDTGWSGAKSGFAMGTVNGAITGYMAVKASKVANASNATQTQAEPTGKKDMAAVRAAGVAGENAAGIDPNLPKEKIIVNNRTRIPDELNHTNKILIEVKNVKHQSFTRQLRDFYQYSIDNGYKMHLYLPPGVPVTPQLQQQFDNGTILRLKLIIK